MGSNQLPDLIGRRVLVPGGTGAVGEGVVRRYLAAGAEVVVPTRSEERSKEFRSLLGPAVSEHLHLVVHDYPSLAGAEALVEQTTRFLGGVDDGVAPLGGWWAGGPLWQVGEQDWQEAFVSLATTHLAVLRAALPTMSRRGAYSLVVGDSATSPVPGSGLVSMEQAALLMMQRVAAAEAGDSRRIFAVLLGPVRTRAVAGAPGWITSDQVGAAATTLSASDLSSATVPMHGLAELERLVEQATGAAAIA